MMAFSYLAQLLRCERCNAVPGDWCVTRTGRRATYLHSARTFPTQQIWFEGYHEGQDDVIRAVDDTSQWSVGYVNQIRERIS